MMLTFRQFHSAWPHRFSLRIRPVLIEALRFGPGERMCGKSVRRVSSIETESPMNVSDYTIRIEWSDDENCYVADIVELPACIAYGGTPKEARDALCDVAHEWLTIARRIGKPIPPPKEPVYI